MKPTVDAAKTVEIPLGYLQTFVKKFKAKQSQIKSYNSVANLVKRAGIKVTKISGSNYRFNGNKIDAEVYFNTDCEITYWTFWTEDLDCTEHEVQFRTKSDVMHYLLTLELN